MHFFLDLFHMMFKAVSATPLCAVAETAPTADAIVAHISLFPCFIAQFTLALLAAGSTERVLCSITFYEIMSLPIGVL
jgi:hypothetical protein